MGMSSFRRMKLVRDREEMHKREVEEAVEAMQTEPIVEDNKTPEVSEEAKKTDAEKMKGKKR